MEYPHILEYLVINSTILFPSPCIMLCLSYFVSFIIISTPFFDFLAAQSEERECAYTEKPHGEGRVFRENSTIRCNHGGHCFGLWVKKNNEILIKKQGI